MNLPKMVLVDEREPRLSASTVSHLSPTGESEMAWKVPMSIAWSKKNLPLRKRRDS